jgi:hypothetical protein
MIIHGGIERAGSTFLQEVVFPRLRLNRYDAEYSRKLKLLGRDAISSLPKEITDGFKRLKGTKVVLSRESFFATHHHYTGETFYASELALSNAKTLLEEDLKLLMVLRRQDSAIDSMVKYKKRYVSAPNMLLADYPVRLDRFGRYSLSSQYARLLRSYDYYRSIAIARNMLGAQNVCVVLYEDLIHDPKKFFQVISEFFEEDLSALEALSCHRMNAHSSKYDDLVSGYVTMGPLLRAANNLSGFRLEKLLPKRAAALTDHSRQELLALFQQDNIKLANLLGIDLGKYGYC